MGLQLYWIRIALNHFFIYLRAASEDDDLLALEIRICIDAI